VKINLTVWDKADMDGAITWRDEPLVIDLPGISAPVTLVVSYDFVE
jgi:hypothetical protein